MAQFTESFAGAIGPIGGPWIHVSGYGDLARDGAGHGGHPTADTAGLIPPPVGFDFSNQYNVSAIVVNLDNQRGVWARTTADSNTLWQHWVQPTGASEFWRRVAGSWSNVDANLAAGTIAIGDRVGLHVDNVAQTIQRTINGVLVGGPMSTAGVATDNYNGLLAYAGGYVDDFIVDDLGGSGGTPRDVSGAATFPAFVAAGTVTIVRNLSGAATFPAFVAAGTMTPQNVRNLSGTATFPALVAAGTIVRPRQVQGAAQFPAFVAVGAINAAVPVGSAIIRRRSAMSALQVGIDAALAADPAWVARMADRVYSLGTVPKSPVAPYLELGESTEAPERHFMHGGNTHDETLTIVAPKSGGKIGVGAILADLVRILDGQQLALEGHDVVTARVELLTIFADPDVEHVRGVVHYRATTFARAL